MSLPRAYGRYLKRSARAAELQLAAREFHQHVDEERKEGWHYLIAEEEALDAYLEWRDRLDRDREYAEEMARYDPYDDPWDYDYDPFYSAWDEIHHPI
jgi:hypothetical protein